MTSYAQLSVTCAICRTVSTQAGLRSTNTFQRPDLDFRPGEMMRSTMHAWVQQCPSCGYCTVNLSKASAAASATVEADRYRNVLQDESYPELARQFLACAMVAEADVEWTNAAEAYLRAAWVCDDDPSREDRAASCRTKAIEMFRRGSGVSSEPRHEVPAGHLESLLADLLRRVDRFEEAEVTCGQGLERSSDGPVAAALRYQRQLIAARDTRRHTLHEAMQAYAPSLLEPDEARRQAQADAKQVSPRARQIGREVERAGRTCSHCGEPGRKGFDFYLRRGPQSAVICRRCGSPQV